MATIHREAFTRDAIRVSPQDSLCHAIRLDRGTRSVLDITQLLKQGSYRSGTWAPTAELSGAIAQSQENVRVALDELGVEHRVADGNGYLTGEELYSVQPRSFLVVGNLNEFRGDHGVSTARFRSFEDFRRNIRQPEIITFDELYERAKFIVDSSCGQANETPPQDDKNDIPF